MKHIFLLIVGIALMAELGSCVAPKAEVEEAESARVPDITNNDQDLKEFP
eukprot:CAMPEP_0114039566 /NCGR_PEP_ID=MMETSP1339-20121228/3433_1 /TAXON_ID=94617 /ORGANISM="Fibrocapsa japonica" /LENGTH=49 /assembly_acc=CAM_ASM_000762